MALNLNLRYRATGPRGHDITRSPSDTPGDIRTDPPLRWPLEKLRHSEI